MTDSPLRLEMVYPWRLTRSTAALSQKTELFCLAAFISGCHSDKEGNAKRTESRRCLCEIESLCPSISSSRDSSSVVQTVGGWFSL